MDKSPKEYLDIIGRPLKVGDHVVSFNNIYKIMGFRFKGRDATIFLREPSPTTKKKNQPCNSLVLLPEEDMIMWILKRQANEG